MEKIRYLLGLALLCLSLTIHAQITGIGKAAVTCGTITDSEYVMGIIDVRDRSAAPLAVNWSPPMYHHPDWTAARMGHLFGITIGKGDNMYVTATSVYANATYGSAGSGGVYKIDAATGAVSDFASLPASSSSLGNICYDRQHGQLFVTNRGDNKIYRLDETTGAIRSTYAPGPALFGINVNPVDGRLYFALGVSIYSVGLTETGDFSGTAVLEVTIPIYSSSPIASIAFSSTGKMLVAQRGSPHLSAIFQYSGSVSQSWSEPQQIFIGNYNSDSSNPVHINSAGGVAYGYGSFNPDTESTGTADEWIWGTGDALRFPNTNPDGINDYVYGMAGMPASGNSYVPEAMNWVKTSSYYIDFDGVTSSQAKGQIGAVVIFTEDVFDQEILVKWPRVYDEVWPDPTDDRPIICEIRVKKPDGRVEYKGKTKASGKLLVKGLAPGDVIQVEQVAFPEQARGEFTVSQTATAPEALTITISPAFMSPKLD